MIYDLAIIGSGPAGLSASVYASRYGIKNVVIGDVPGGIASQTHDIGNWLGTQKISGFEFSQNAAEHAKSLGTEIIPVTAEEIKKVENLFSISLNDGKNIEAKTIVLATGTKRRELGVSGEKEFIGKGVSYCATCDGFFYKNKTVAVVGGGDAATSAAAFLADIAEKVYLIVREENLMCESFWHENISKNPKIIVLYDIQITKIEGDKKVSSIILSKPYENSEKILVDGVFIEIGSMPNTDIAKKLGIELDEEGCIKIDPNGKTNVGGIWAAGDATTGSNKLKQIITAAAEGAIAVNSIQQFLKK
jgi:thioredoxin reductase (NADPH)